MARVTVEDCVVKVPNRFELVLLAAQRAREITSGAPLSIDRDDDKNPVVALREIADETVGLAHLKESVVRGMQKQVELDEVEEAQEIEVDPAVFGFALPADGGAGTAAGFGNSESGDEAGLDDEIGDDDDALDEELAADGALTADGELAADEEMSADEEMAADVLNVEGEDDADLADLPDGEPSGEEDEEADEA